MGKPALKLSLADQWREALADLEVKHPNPLARPKLLVHGIEDATLTVSIEQHRDTRGVNDTLWSEFPISNVRLTFFPGEKMARIWIAAAWAGYLQHEALELVSVGDENPLDPHQQPYPLNPWNRGLRDGFPPVLDRDTLIASLAVVMDREHAIRMVEAEL